MTACPLRVFAVVVVVSVVKIMVGKRHEFSYGRRRSLRKISRKDREYYYARPLSVWGGYTRPTVWRTSNPSNCG